MREGLRHTSGQFDPDAESSTGLTPARLKHAREVENHAVRLRTSNYLPWPSPSLCLLPPDYSRLFSLLASTCFICLSLCLSVCLSGCLFIFVCLSACLFDCQVLPGNRLVPIDFGRRKFAKTELTPQPRSRMISISSLSPS